MRGGGPGRINPLRVRRFQRTKAERIDQTGLGELNQQQLLGTGAARPEQFIQRPRTLRDYREHRFAGQGGFCRFDYLISDVYQRRMVPAFVINNPLKRTVLSRLRPGCGETGNLGLAEIVKNPGQPLQFRLRQGMFVNLPSFVGEYAVAVKNAIH